MTVVKNPKSCDCDISEVVGNSYQIEANCSVIFSSSYLCLFDSLQIPL